MPLKPASYLPKPLLEYINMLEKDKAYSRQTGTTCALPAVLRRTVPICKGEQGLWREAIHGAEDEHGGTHHADL